MSDDHAVPPALARLAARHGIADHYWDVGGTRHATSERTLRSLLVALGALERADASEDAVARALAAEEASDWQRALPPVAVLYEAEPAALELTLRGRSGGARWCWSLETESRERHTDGFVPETLGSGADGASGPDGARRARLPLPALPLGYHVLRVAPEEASGDDALPEAGRATRLIVAPRRCHLPDEEARFWGLAVQLYALRSARNWGIGDFTDLAAVIERVAALEGDCVGLNPLHALFTHVPEEASPYSPSSRLFLNPLAIDVEAVAGFADAGEAISVPPPAGHPGGTEPADASGTDATALEVHLDALRAGDFIDYTAVAATKRAGFEALWQVFVARDLGRDTPRGRAFATFREAGGEPLARFALFEALREAEDAAGGIGSDWRQWPEEMRSPDSAAVRAFAREHAERVDFHAWLQWLARGQLDAAAAAAREARLAVGLYLDLAVGIAAGGADAWADRGLYLEGVQVGAPPDEFSPGGQDWGLPPFHPQALREAGYAPFAAMLRANMRAAGAIRIDHVMGLARLFCIPSGESAVEGAYLAYPLEELLAVVALESRRARCIVVGEDLGTVPEGFRERLAEAGVLSYKLLYFEKRYDGDGEYRAPEEYARDALVVADSHDLPTLRGFWRESDIDLRAELGLFPRAELVGEQRWARGEDRARILRALAREGLLPPGVAADASSAVAMDEALVEMIHVFLARTPSRLVLAGAEDLLGQLEQVNLPGTDRDLHPNWRRRLPLPIEDWQTHAPLASAARAMASARRREG